MCWFEVLRYTIYIYIRFNILVLTPVNEYNIVDKIHSANNLLFSSIEQNIRVDMEPLNSENSPNKIDRYRLQSKHRVTFSSDIEEYEDEVSETESVDIQYRDDIANDNEVAEIIERDEKASIEQQSIINTQIDGMLKRMSIEQVFKNDEDSLSDDIDYRTEFDIIEEINDAIIKETQNETSIERTAHVEIASVPIEEVIQSDSNLKNEQTVQIDIKTDVENKQNAEIPVKKRSSSAIQTNNVPPCRVCNKAKNTQSTVRSATTIRPTSLGQRVTSAIRPTNKCEQDILRIHLNVRSCCENKYLDNNRLPRYNGYISQYGLSKDQLELRELNRQKYCEKRARREREIMRAKQQIADLNEQAFRQWLIRKNHLARPKCKNMYDVVEPKPKIKYNNSAKFRKLSGNSA